MVVVQICSHTGATYRICHMVAETISVKCAEHSYQHSASDLALILCTCLLSSLMIHFSHKHTNLVPLIVSMNAISHEVAFFVKWIVRKWIISLNAISNGVVFSCKSSAKNLITGELLLFFFMNHSSGITWWAP